MHNKLFLSVTLFPSFRPAYSLILWQFALSKLIRGNELELAVSMGMAMNDNSHMYHLAVELLARKCERLGKW